MRPASIAGHIACFEERIVLPNLVHDTAYRRTRRALIDAAHRLDDGVVRFLHDRRRVLFEAASPLSVAIVRPLFDRLRHDDRLQFWCTATDESWQASDIFRDQAIAGRVVSARQARWMKFDLYVNTDFWNMTWLPRRTRRIHLFHGVAGKYELDAPVDLAPTIATFDRLFFPNADRMNRYRAAGLIDPAHEQGVLTGYPKVDCLVDGSLDREEILSTLGLCSHRPTVLYAPTWSPYSSLNAHGEAIVRTLLRLDVNVIVKLHDRSSGTARRGSGGIDWRKQLSGLGGPDRLHIGTNADISPYLVASDLLVTDHSSAGFEFMLLDRPVLVIDSPTLVSQARISPHKLRLMRQASDVAPDVDALASILIRALDTPARLSAQRRAVATELFHDPGRATAHAAESTYRVLGLTPPSEALAPRLSPSLSRIAASTHLTHLR